MNLRADHGTIYLLNEIAEFLEGQSDVRDGSYGEQIPNRAMSLLQLIEQEIDAIKRSGDGRDKLIEQCAAVADREWVGENSLIGSRVAGTIARAIRGLKSSACSATRHGSKETK